MANEINADLRLSGFMSFFNLNVRVAAKDVSTYNAEVLCTKNGLVWPPARSLSDIPDVIRWIEKEGYQIGRKSENLVSNH
jgi:hypothetical protein